MKKDDRLISEAYDQMIVENAIDKVQTALDVAGLEPTAGSIADGANSVISLLRSAMAKEPDDRKKHLMNAGISAVSLIPFADFVKLLKARKVSKPLVKGAVKASRGVKGYASKQKMSNRFN